MSVSCVEGYLVEQSKDDLEHHWLSAVCEDQHVTFFQPNPLIHRQIHIGKYIGKYLGKYNNQMVYIYKAVSITHLIITQIWIKHSLMTHKHFTHVYEGIIGNGHFSIIPL